MSAAILDGKALALEIREDLKQHIPALSEKLGRKPGIAVVLVGDDPASAIYVRNKERAAEAIGMMSKVVRLSADTPQEKIIAEVEALNADPQIDAFLVQLPLPAGIDADTVTAAIAPHKDADGLHPNNLGKLLVGVDAPRPCTPSGVMAMLDKSGVELKGAHAVVVGRSAIVGKPQALLLLERHCTVTICHSRTKDLAAEVGRADVVVAAVGKAELVKGSWIKEGAVVIDVGINRVNDKLVGDVEFAAAKERAGAITPVPGGVGPMTIALLLKNAVDAAARSL